MYIHTRIFNDLSHLQGPKRKEPNFFSVFEFMSKLKKKKKTEYIKVFKIVKNYNKLKFKRNFVVIKKKNNYFIT